MDSHTGAALRASQVLHSLLAADSSPSFHEPSMVDFSGIRPRRRRSAAESDESEAEHPGRQPEKKRRLTAAQVQFLERSFEVDNKLEPERKNELAKDLHLQPRQVAIWFQNRRARFKTKQLERDYAALQSTFDSLKSHYDHLLNHKDQLQNEVNLLRAKLKLREGNLNSGPHREALLVKAEVACKLEEASSAKSDVFDDSESPHSTSQVYEAEFSRADLTGGFMEVADYGFGEAVEGHFQGGSCGGLGLPGLEGHPAAYWPWLY